MYCPVSAWLSNKSLIWHKSMTIQTTPHEVVPGLLCDWQPDKSLLILRVESLAPNVIETFFNTIMAVQAHHPLEQNFFGLYDFSKTPRIRITPQIRVGSRQAARLVPALKGRTAVVLSGVPAIVLNMIGFFVQREVQSLQPGEQFELFNNEPDAIKWLQELMQPSQV